MSDDFVSYVAWLRPSVARIVMDAASGVEAEIEGADGRVVYRPGVDRPFMPKKIARAVGKAAPLPADISVSAADTSMLATDDLEKFGLSVKSQHFPLLPLIDRVVAIPHGVRFMEGFAFSRLRTNRRALLAKEWPILLERVGGAKKVARLLATYIEKGGGEDAAHAMLDAITKGLAKAEEKERDLVLLAVDMST